MWGQGPYGKSLPSQFCCGSKTALKKKVFKEVGLVQKEEQASLLGEGGLSGKGFPSGVLSGSVPAEGGRV